MAYFLIENFNSGLDLRRSTEVAPTGSLRVLRNAFINAGGEVEKRRAFGLHEALTEYCQDVNYRGKITGPHPVPGHPGYALFRHRHDSLPSSGDWTVGGGQAVSLTVGSGLNALKFWAMKSTAALPNFGAMMHGASYSEFASDGYVVEQYVANPSLDFTWQHFQIAFDASGEPTGETAISANDGRAFQLTLNSKSYVIEGDTLHASALGDPTAMSGPGSGFLNFSSQGAKAIGKALSLSEYFGQLAVCGRRGVQFYTVDPDFDKTQYQRTVATSVFAPRSLTGYADGDVIYLGRNGVRSLQARDSSNLAAVTDVGSPIDALIEADLRYRADDQEFLFTPASPDVHLSDFYSLAKGIVHPQSGDFWLFLKEKIYVLSRHSGARVLAWSQFDMPNVQPGGTSTVNGPEKSRWCADVAQVGETLVVRNFADEVFIYGGDAGEDYDDATVEIVTPFMDMGRPGDTKYFKGLDLVAEGYWRVEYATMPVSDDEEISWDLIGEFDNGTRDDQRPWFEAQGTQIALRLTCSSKRRSLISQIGIYYETGAQK